jgi:diadenosine tetraphosphatase ApaH/serine/threonine PP2A family protein phosphatase
VRYAVISDVHASCEALAAVLEHVRENDVHRILCCGDVVGYYTDPNECLQVLRENDITCVRGNHDVSAAGVRDLDCWWLGIKAIKWTRKNLTEVNRQFLRALPETVVVDGSFLIFHGALHDGPYHEDVRIESRDDALLTLQALASHDSGVRVAFHGHTHRGAVYEWDGQRVCGYLPETVVLDQERYYLVNVGSVGQPRDGDPRASYAIYDTRERAVFFHRVPFDTEGRDRKARKRGLGRNPLRRRVRGWLGRTARRLAPGLLKRLRRPTAA